jgi:MoaA/NifB/PqqE/SkfB family radical SAM enzyme
MIEGIRSMARAKAARRSPHPLLQIHHPIGSASYRNLSRFVDLAIRTGCNAVSFSPMKNAQGALSSCGLTPEMEAEAIASLQREKPRLEEAGIRHNVRETILRYRLGEAVWKNAPCYTPWLQTRIKADGIVQPCNPCRLPMGNLREQSFPTIWNGARYQAFRRGWLAAPPGSPPPEACDCGFCCFLPDHLRVHRVYKWFLPLFRPREADGSSSC